MRSYSNPRLVAEFSDWPIGGSLRGKCRFEVHTEKRGARVSRTTQNKHGVWCKPKFHVYGDGTAIVDGDDGKTYILQLSKSFNAIYVALHDFMSPADESCVSHSSDPKRFEELLSLIKSAGSPAIL